MSAVRVWLVTYDVREPRRLTRIHRFLVRRALPLQKSVFLFRGDRVAAERLAAILAKLVRRVDDLRLYPLPSGTRLVLHGAGPLPPGVVLVDAELERLLGRWTGRAKRGR